VGFIQALNLILVSHLASSTANQLKISITRAELENIKNSFKSVGVAGLALHILKLGCPKIKCLKWAYWFKYPY
jgi:hypothetical protein